MKSQLEQRTVEFDGGHYRITEDGTAYHADTEEAIVYLLQNARTSGTRLRIHYGNAKTGQAWGDVVRTAKQAVTFLDNARIHVAYRDNSEASCLAEWIFFNARSIVRAEAEGDANYVLTLGRIRQEKLRTAR